MLEEMRVKLFTHNDLDGVGAAVLAKSYFGNYLDYEICSNDNVNEKVIQFIESDEYINYNMIYIVDLSVNEEIADLINSFIYLPKVGVISLIDFNKVTLLDHHKTTEWLNKYSWANVVVENKDGIKECGTSLLYKYLIHLGFNRTQVKNDFVEAVRSYDTWDWKTNNNPYAKKLHDILNIIGVEEFIEEYVNTLLTYGEFYITKTFESLLKYKKLETEKFIEYKLKQVFFTENYATVLCDNYDCLSELGSRILQEYPILDYVKLVYPGGIALRSVGDFDVSIIAKENDGGGHKNAAGYKDNKWYLHMEQK